MGACCSWCKEDDAYGNTDQERSHLLPDPACNTTIQHGAMPEDYHYGTLPTETEEQAGLNRILNEITTNVIDVGAFHNCIDPAEVTERQNHYAAKLQNAPASSFANTMASLKRDPGCILKDVPSADRMCGRKIGLPKNYREIMSQVTEIQRLFANMSVEHKGDLVVNF